MKAQWLNDIKDLVDGIPFGEITPVITKAATHVTKVKVASSEVIRYDQTNTALEDIAQLIQNMNGANYDGEVTFKLLMKDGEIQRVAYYNERITNYSDLRQKNNGKKTPDTKK